MIIVDAHEDLAWNMLTFNRDYRRPAAETRELESGGEAAKHNGNTLLGREDWIKGRVAMVFATLFAAPARRRKGAWDHQCYEDSEEAHRLYKGQLDAYRRLVEQQDEFRLILSRVDLEEIVREWELFERAGDTGELVELEAPPLGCVVLMEGSDGVRRPEELHEWHELGVRLVGPAWAGTRHAGGTGEPGPLTPEGLQLLDVMAELGMTLDLSHLAEQAVFQALERYDGTVLASHSNPQALLEGTDHPDRHLPDEAIRGIAEHDGVIGIVPYNRFLDAEWRREDPKETVSIERVAEHVDYVCQLVGSANHVGLGSDFDGGFGWESVPTELDTVADLRLIGTALKERGYADVDVNAILSGNWIRVIERSL